MKPIETEICVAGGTNFDPAKDMHMHEGSITIIDDDHIEWKWAGYDQGKPAEGHGVARKLARKANSLSNPKRANARRSRK